MLEEGHTCYKGSRDVFHLDNCSFVSHIIEVEELRPDLPQIFIPKDHVEIHMLLQTLVLECCSIGR